MKKTLFFQKKTGSSAGSGGTVYAYCTPLVRCTVKEARDEGVEKHSCQIELSGAHLKLVYYNGKQVLRAFIMVHVTVVLDVRNEDEFTDTHVYMLW